MYVCVCAGKLSEEGDVRKPGRADVVVLCVLGCVCCLDECRQEARLVPAASTTQQRVH
eukprot:m.13783 g.13783  ORF g.13783 m.13783 type:complete len:58 (+) comp4655_c0_seq1:1644-1817(+)